MDSASSKRNTWLACPGCGHKVARVRTCDIDFKCKYCACEFEVIIGPSAPPASEQSSRLPADHDKKGAA
jgi:hypothetical protein